jgi:hypothetical protein
LALPTEVSAAQRAEVSSLPLLRRKPINQRQPIKALAKSAGEIIGPALGAQAAPQPDLLHRQAENQNLVHQRRAVGAEFALSAVEPQHGLALAFGDRLPRLPAVDIFPRRIRAAFCNLLRFACAIWTSPWKLKIQKCRLRGWRVMPPRQA